MIGFTFRAFRRGQLRHPVHMDLYNCHDCSAFLYRYDNWMTNYLMIITGLVANARRSSLLQDPSSHEVSIFSRSLHIKSKTVMIQNRTCHKYIALDESLLDGVNCVIKSKRGVAPLEYLHSSKNVGYTNSCIFDSHGQYMTDNNIRTLQWPSSEKRLIRHF